MENDYFLHGSAVAVKRLEQAGIVLPPMDFEKYSQKKLLDTAEASLSIT